MSTQTKSDVITRLTLNKGVVHLAHEDEGGGLLGERTLGPLDGSLYGLLPRSLWWQIDVWLAEKHEAERYEADYRAEVMRWR